MENKNISIAIIPARGGSKRIRKKNIKNFCSKPILYWTLKVLKQSKLFAQIVLTTDDNEIKTIGNNHRKKQGNGVIRVAEEKDVPTGGDNISEVSVAKQYKH